MAINNLSPCKTVSLTVVNLQGFSFPLEDVMPREGYVKVWRKILDNPIVMKDADHFAVWCWLILEATHAEIDKVFKGKRITLKPGQLITSRQTIATTLKINESKVERILKTLKIEQQIEQQADSRCRLVTLVSWDRFQFIEQQNGQQVDSNRTAIEHTQECKNERMEESKDISESKDSSCPERKIPPAPKVGFDQDAHKFTNLDMKIVDLWQETFPAIDVIGEMKKAVAWLLANPKNRKSNYQKFLVSWFSRAQDKAPRVTGQDKGRSSSGGKILIGRLPDSPEEAKA